MYIVESSNIKIDDIILKQKQNPNDINAYIVIYNKPGNYNIEFYSRYLVFCSIKNNYNSNKIILIINIVDENEFYNKKIIEFRKEYDLNENDYPNEKLLVRLKSSYFNFNDTFSSFYN